jgi:hypothetical protein
MSCCYLLQYVVILLYPATLLYTLLPSSTLLSCYLRPCYPATPPPCHLSVPCCPAALLPCWPSPLANPTALLPCLPATQQYPAVFFCCCCLDTMLHCYGNTFQPCYPATLLPCYSVTLLPWYPGQDVISDSGFSRCLYLGSRYNTCLLSCQCM